MGAVTNSWHCCGWMLGRGAGDLHRSCDVATPRSFGYAAIGTPAAPDGLTNLATIRVRAGEAEAGGEAPPNVRVTLGSGHCADMPGRSEKCQKAASMGFAGAAHYFNR